MKGKRVKKATGQRIRPPMKVIKVNKPLLMNLAIIVLLVIWVLQVVKLTTLKSELGQLTTQAETIVENQEELKMLILQAETPHPTLEQDTPKPASPNIDLEPSPTMSMLYAPTGEELEMLAKVVYREARGIEDQAQQAAVIWCILNRVDTHSSEWGDTIESVITYPNAFAWIPNTPVETRFLLLAADVCERWNLEKAGATQVGRTLPSTYLFFTGDGRVNNFTEEWKGTEYWDWSLPSPY